jgi:F-type H+-transporting ATPase subunit b
MLDEAKEEADRKRKELTHKAREEVNQARQRWHQSVEKEKNAFLQDLRRMTVREVHAISRRALEDLADVDLEERLVDVFISRFNQLEKDKKDAILRGIREENKVGIRSGFELSSGSRRKIMKMLKEEGFQEIDATYETDPRVTMGIEVKSRGEKVAWSIRDYIAALEDRANAAIERQIQQADEAPKPSAETETAAERDPEHKRTSKTNGGKTASVQETRE